MPDTAMADITEVLIDIHEVETLGSRLDDGCRAAIAGAGLEEQAFGENFPW